MIHLPIPNFLPLRSTLGGGILLLCCLLFVARTELKAEFTVSEAGDDLVFSGALSRLRIDKTTGAVEEYSYRLDPSANWTVLSLHIEGVQKDVLGTEFSITTQTPVIDHTILADHLLIRAGVRLQGLYWNFWYALNEKTPAVEMARFAYGEQQGLQLRGVGLRLEATGLSATASAQEYNELGGAYSGGILDLKSGTSHIQFQISNHADQVWEIDGDVHTLWYRNLSTSWGTKIDYRRFALVPLAGDETPSDPTDYTRLFVFDHPLTNVERVGSWIFRYKNANGNVRDWFNASNFQNSFIPGTGPGGTNRAGFWRDDWTTGALLRQIKVTYDVTREPFYFMRLVDLVDYQINRSENRLKSQWGANNPWQENYPMGRIQAAMEVYELTGWTHYRDIAVNSVEWFFTTEDFVPEKGHSEDFNLDYLDLSYSIEGLFKADAQNNGKYHTMISNWWKNIENSTWNEAHGLYGHNLASNNRLNTHWGRGHGWWFETFCGIYPYYTADDAHVFLEHFQIAADELIERQNGVWYRMIDDPSTYLEASAGSMIASGMIRAFFAGYLDTPALESGFEALSTLTTDMMAEDGTLVGTDRGSYSSDPFPYTQEGYVRAARDLGIVEIVEAAADSTLVSTFADGVLIANSSGGVITDAAGLTVGVNGRIVIDEYDPANDFMRVLGVGERTITLEGFSPNEVVTLTNHDIRQGSANTFSAISDASGTLQFDLVLDGEHHVSLTPRPRDTLFADYAITGDGFFKFTTFGWCYEGYWPYLWSNRTGWIYVWVGSTLDSLYYYDFTDNHWHWTREGWGGWHYDFEDQVWDTYADE